MSISTEREQRALDVSRVVAEEVRALLGRRHLAGRALVPVLGMSQQAVSQRLRGDSVWTVGNIAAAAAFFAVDANALLPGVGRRGVGADDEPAGATRGLPHLDSNQEPAG